MIILRHKLFSRRDIFSDNLRNEFEPDNKTLGGRKLIIKIERADEFKEQYNTSTLTVRSKVDKYIKQLKTIPISRFENAGDSEADTHYLADYSSTHTTVPDDDRYVVFSKWLTSGDRFNYRIYKPRIMKDQEGNEIMTQKIVLCTCWDHTINGKPGSYVGGQEGNQWNNNNKAARRRRKLEKRERQMNKNKS